MCRLLLLNLPTFRSTCATEFTVKLVPSRFVSPYLIWLVFADKSIAPLVPDTFSPAQLVIDRAQTILLLLVTPRQSANSAKIKYELNASDNYPVNGHFIGNTRLSLCYVAVNCPEASWRLPVNYCAFVRCFAQVVKFAARE